MPDTEAVFRQGNAEFAMQTGKGGTWGKELSCTTDTLALQDIPVTCWKRDASALPAAGQAAGEVQSSALPSMNMSSQQQEFTSGFFMRFSAHLQLNCDSP